MMTPPSIEPRRLTLNALRDVLKRDAAVHAHLGGLRAFNHLMLAELGKCCPLPGSTMLDVGASVHGYALEAALDQGVSRYEGIDFDMTRHWGAPLIEIEGLENRVGRLRQMDAEQLAFPDETFDCLLSISTFEHFHRPDAVLVEMHRVLRPGGVALVSFEPVWTASYGHHLHHFGAVSDLVPPWSHLFLGQEQMAAVLARQTWPADAPVDRAAALHWIYEGDGINRHDIRRLKSSFAASPFEVVWMSALPDVSTPEHAATAAYLARVLPYRAEELLTRGLSLLLRKPRPVKGIPVHSSVWRTTRLISRAGTAAVLAVFLCFASCKRQPVPALHPPPLAEPDNGVAFVSGFYKEEVLAPKTVLRWVGQEAVLRVDAPSDGQYRITFRPFTVFSMEEDIIEMKVNGQSAGKFSTKAFSVGDAIPTPVEVTLRAGGNDIALHSTRPVARLGENDERVAAFGLLLPITVEPVP